MPVTTHPVWFISVLLGLLGLMAVATAVILLTQTYVTDGIRRVVEVGQELNRLTLLAVVATLILVEGGTMLAEQFLNAREKKCRTEGRALERADWVAWQERLDAWETRRTQALEEGREFTEERPAPPA